MSDAILAALIGGIAGLVTGTIGSLIAPWVHWGIEKRRSQIERQRTLIDNARLKLSGGKPSRENIRQSSAYAIIRSHLSPELVNNIEQINRSGGEETIQKNIMKELAELEKKWKLI
jgi:hypothetical protein